VNDPETSLIARRFRKGVAEHEGLRCVPPRIIAGLYAPTHDDRVFTVHFQDGRVRRRVEEANLGRRYVLFAVASPAVTTSDPPTTKRTANIAETERKTY
jgi:hypothetical protein